MEEETNINTSLIMEDLPKTASGARDRSERAGVVLARRSSRPTFGHLAKVLDPFSETNATATVV